MRAVSFASASLSIALSIAACAAGHGEADAGADGPSRSRPAAAPASSSVAPADAAARPPLAPASLTEGPASPSQATASAPAACPPDMVLVDGDYCTEVSQPCAAWEDPPSNPLARCARFAASRCVGRRVHERFCIDRDEYTPPGESLPMGGVSWAQARALCAQQGKRLCKETEWELACEGEQMLPYPTGYERDPGACNFDRADLVDPKTGKLRDQREPSAKLAGCVSPFGVRNMTGNVDEWVWRDRTPGPYRSALKGGWWMAARERCRPATTVHGEQFSELQTGVRCCADAR
jgi:sulfatase modifying factor 1